MYFQHYSATTAMKKTFLLASSLLLSFALGYFLNVLAHPTSQNPNFGAKVDDFNEQPLELGAFSLSLNVENLVVSKEFYEKLGFNAFAGSLDQNYLIMKNDDVLIGLFQGMFEGNIITFNPGWDQEGKDLDHFEDIRSIQKKIRQAGLSFILEADEEVDGPASFLLAEPDGNVILVDQHR